MPYWYIWLPVIGQIFFLFYLLAWADYLEKETYLCRLMEDDNKRLTAEVARLRRENAALTSKRNFGRLELGGGE